MKKSKPSNQDDDKVIVRINTANYAKKNSSNNFSRQVSELAKVTQQISRLYVPVFKTEIPKIYDVTTQLTEALRSSQLAVNKAITDMASSGVLDAIKRITESFTKLTGGLKAHFPDNWHPDDMDKCDDLCMQGVPIIFVPRAEVVSKITKAKNMAGIKQVINKNDDAIIEDCEKAIAEANWLSKDMKEQIRESIDSYKCKKYRAAQSTATVAFDCLLNEIIDIRQWRRANNDSKALSARKVKQLTDEFTGDLMELPVSRAPFYTLMMFPIIGQMLATFEIGDKASYKNDFNRHMSAHTVSSRQYKRSNALLAIMTIASICKITQLRGKNWMQVSAKEYGVGL